MSFLSFHAIKPLHTAEGEQCLDISFSLQKGTLLALCGPSGAGKTTLLRILAGLTDTTSSYIEIDNQVWLDTNNKKNLPTRHRSIGFVFQDFALFPNLTVRQQLDFALPKGANRKSIEDLLKFMELEELQNKLPANLSGGQQQRVALARAIARKPKLLLLDEPLSALDDQMRLKLQDFILSAHRIYNLTTILVSHHLPEIFRLADEVILLDKGRIQKQGTPANIFMQEMISSEFQTTGEIIAIESADIVYIISVLSGSNIVKVVATAEETKYLYIGQKIIVASSSPSVLIPANLSGLSRKK